MEGVITIEFTYTKFSEAWTFLDAVEAFAADDHPAKGIKLTSVDKTLEPA